MSDGYDVRAGDGAPDARHAGPRRRGLARAPARPHRRRRGDGLVVRRPGRRRAAPVGPRRRHRAGGHDRAADLPDVVLGRPVAGGLAWPPNGVTDDGTLDVLRATGAQVVVLSSAALPPTPRRALHPEQRGRPRHRRLPAAGRGVRPGGVAARHRPRAHDEDPRRRPGGAPAAGARRDRAHHAAAARGVAHVRHRAADALGDRCGVGPRARHRGRRLALGPALPARRPRRGRHEQRAAPARRLPARGAQGRAQPLLPRLGRAHARVAGRPALRGTRRPRHRHDRHRGLRVGAHARRVRGLARRPRRRAAAGHDPDQADRHADRPGQGAVAGAGDAARRLGRHPGHRRQRPRPARRGSACGSRARPPCASTPPTSPPSRWPPARSARSRSARAWSAPARSVVDIVLLTPEGDEFGGRCAPRSARRPTRCAAQWVVIGLFAILVVLLGVNVVRRRRTKAAGGAS